MNTDPVLPDEFLTDADQLIEPVEFRFALRRRAFVQVLGAGLLIAAGPMPARAQRARRGGEGNPDPAGRIQIGVDGSITVLTGKVEIGQGSRAEITQAAAEELRVAPSRIQLIMADTGRVPNDGLTAGSRTTPSTIPMVRKAAAIAREVLVAIAAERWSVDAGSVEVGDAVVIHAPTQRRIAFAELATGDNLKAALQKASDSTAALTDTKDLKTLGKSFPRPNARDLVTGAHRYPSDIQRPGMLHGAVLRPPAYNVKLISIDLDPARKLPEVSVVHDGDFVGVCAPNSFLARQALQTATAGAKWTKPDHPSSAALPDHLRQHARDGVPPNPFAAQLEAAAKRLRATYHVAYVQHAPMETRAAVAEWNDGSLTVWTGTQNPFGVRGELARALRLPEEKVRVIVPDTGGGFGGKHTGEAAIEAARLAQSAGKPVSLKWSREEEFTWAYFRPAAVIDIEAGLDDGGRLTSWHFVNINAGRAAVETPYRAGQARSRTVDTNPPLRQGSYRALGSTASNFARECFMDELAAAAGTDPLAFRLAHLDDSPNAARLRAVLQEAARRFKWADRAGRKSHDTGIGLACGTEKGSYVAACAEVAIDHERNTLKVRKVCQVFECGTILNPDNLRSQVEGALLMGLGPALREEMRFSGGQMQNPRFSQYAVPRFSDVPELDIHLLNRPDLPAVGGSETPIIAVAPAIANAVFQATGKPVRAMPIRLPAA